jgi:hypothetical protein
MLRIHRSPSVAPALNLLEDRRLLSSGVSALHEGSPQMVMHAATEVVLVPTGVYNKHMDLVSVRLKAEVESLMSGTGKPTGKVKFDMVMPPGMSMPGMKSGTTILGTATLKSGVATVTIKPSMVLNMPLEIVYNGNMHFQSSTLTPPMLTQSSLMSTSMNMGTSGMSGMGGMKM